MLPPLAAEKLQNFFGVFLQFHIGVDNEQAEREAIQRSIDEDSERITALERIISRVYEDMIAQRISEDNFNRIFGEQPDRAGHVEKPYHAEPETAGPAERTMRTFKSWTL